jgi:hypothetical protein
MRDFCFPTNYTESFVFAAGFVNVMRRRPATEEGRQSALEMASFFLKQYREANLENSKRVHEAIAKADSNA